MEGFLDQLVSLRVDPSGLEVMSDYASSATVSKLVTICASIHGLGSRHVLASLLAVKNKGVLAVNLSAHL